MRDNNEEETITDQVLEQLRVTAGKEHGGPQFEDLAPGSVIMVHKGSYPVALVETISRLPDGHGEEPSFGVDHRIKILSRFREALRIFPQLDAMNGRIPHLGTFFRVNPESNTYGHVSTWYHLIMEKISMDHYLAILKAKSQIILQGPPGTGKTRLAKLIAAELMRFETPDGSSAALDRPNTPGEYKLVQFHPAYSYEDFVRGIVAKVNDEGKVFYETENKILATFAQQAIDQPAVNFVLIIDEINRANLPAVLGELIYALEYRYDPAVPREAVVQGIYTVKTGRSGEQSSNELKLPKNLYLIGTMNSADRSVGHIDYAIRRRFAFVDVLPSVNVLDTAIADEHVRTKAIGLYKQVESLFTAEHLAADFERDQVQLGHSYFIAETQALLQLRLDYEIRPILREYIRDGVLLGSAAEIVANLHA